MKRRGQNSFSIPKNLNSGWRCSSKTMTRQRHSQEKVSNEIESSGSSTSTHSSTSDLGQDVNSTMAMVLTSNYSGSSMDDDGWATDTSVENMRSAELISLDEVIAPPVSFRDGDSAHLDFLPIACSTPHSLPYAKSFRFSVVIDSFKEDVPIASSTLRRDVATQHGEPLAISNISYVNEFVKESDTLKDMDLQLNSISPEQNIQLPDIPDDVNNESQEQREDTDFQLKSISPEQNIELPDIIDDVNDESQEKREELDFLNAENNSIKALYTNRKTSIGIISKAKIGSIVSNESEDQISPFKKHDHTARRDSFACSEVPSSDGFKIFDDSDEYTKQNFDEEDNEYSKNNPFAATVINKSTNSNSGKQKHEDKVENSSEDMDDYSDGEAQNTQIDSSEKKGKGYRVYNRINDSITRWKQKNEGRNLFEYKSDSEENFENVQKIQNNELQDEELNNNQPKTVALQIKRKVKIFAGVDNKGKQDASILNRSLSSTSLRRKHRNEGGNLSEDVDESNRDKSFENVQNIQNGELQDYELDNNGQEIATHHRKTIYQVKFASILSRSTDSNQKKKHGNKIRNSSEDVDNYNGAENFEEAETPKRKGTLCRGVKLKFNKRIKTPLRRKHKNEEENLFEGMDKNDSEESFEKVQNIQDEESQDDELDNYQSESATLQKNRKINKLVGADNITQQDANITNRSRSSSSLRRKHKNEEENSFEDMDKSENEESFENFQKNQNARDKARNSSEDIYNRGDNYDEAQNMDIKHKSEEENSFEDIYDNEERFENVQKNQNDRDKKGNSSEDNYNRGDNFEESQNMDINTSKKMRKPYRGVRVKRNRRVNRSRKAANSLSRSKISTILDVSEDQNNQNIDEKINWPRCCLEEYATLHFGQTFHILQPVFRDDIPIDSITLVNLGIESKKKCKH